MGFRIVTAVALACLALAGCTTVVSPAERNAPLRRALTEPIPELTRAADGGDRSAQYALSFLMRTGVRGVTPDPVRSEDLRSLAARPSSTVITQYIPGINGAPGRTSIIPITLPGLGDAEAQRMDLCGVALLTRQPQLGASVCGGTEAYIALIPAAVSALGESDRDPAPTLAAAGAPIDPASVTRCEDVRPLWLSAIRDLGAGDGDIATDATERIITLCGEGEPSWHARVMRALIAVSDEEPTVAIALLRPVPRPAPAPIGGYVSFVAMQAQAAMGNWSSYREERDTVLRASLAALEHEAKTEAVGDPFEAGGTRVQIFRRPSVMASGLDVELVAPAFPGGERDGPRTFYLTTSADPLDGSKRQYFLDEYRCDGRSTLQYFGVMASAPDASAVRSLIEQRLRGELDQVSGSRFDQGISACQFPSLVAPGLGDN